MWNKKVHVVFFVFLLAGVLSLTYSLPTSTVVIGSTGKISPNHTVNATSGSPTDIQTAVNTIVSAGGGTVYIPAGTFTFNPPANGIGVTIPFTNVPVNIIGAGIGKTILQETMATTSGSGVSSMFVRNWGGQSYNGSAVRISGISFVGYVNTDNAQGDWNYQQNNAISLSCAMDFRIDHCSFQNFAQSAISTDDNTGGTYTLIDRGVIDHCSFDNPYKAAYQPHNATGVFYSLGGYGIAILNNYYTWDSNIADYLGHYYPTKKVNGLPLPQPVYIENCNFTRCRHCISSNGDGWYVVRYCNFAEPAPYRPVDIHGDSGSSDHPWGGRGLEAYDNTFNLKDLSYSNGDCAAFGIRGGGGVILNNTITVPNGGTHDNLGIEFGNDGEAAPYNVESLYWWNNIVQRQDGTQISSSVYINMNGQSYQQNVNYFLRAPTQAQDGFTYTSYIYPLPLTLGP